MLTYIHIYTHIYMYTYTYIYTYISTSMQQLLYLCTVGNKQDLVTAGKDGGRVSGGSGEDCDDARGVEDGQGVPEIAVAACRK
jgi:hypothetical protein